MVGVKKSLGCAEALDPPAPILCLPLHALLEKDLPQELPSDKAGQNNLTKVMQRIIATRENPLDTLYVADIHSTNSGLQINQTMTVTAARAAGRGFYILVSKMRWTSIRELCRLQGSKDGRLNFGRLSRNQIGQLCGNAVPVPLLLLVFSRVLPFITNQEVQGPYSD